MGEHRAARRGANNHDRNTWLFPRQKENSDTLKKEIQICRAIKQLDYYLINKGKILPSQVKGLREPE